MEDPTLTVVHGVVIVARYADGLTIVRQGYRNGNQKHSREWWEAAVNVAGLTVPDASLPRLQYMAHFSNLYTQATHLAHSPKSFLKAKLAMEDALKAMKQIDPLFQPKEGRTVLSDIKRSCTPAQFARIEHHFPIHMRFTT